MIDPNTEVILSATLELIAEQSSLQERDSIGRLLSMYMEGFELQKQEAPGEQPGAIAQRLQTGLDMALQLGQKNVETSQEITCRKGCSHCCYMRTGVLPQEAQLLVETMKQQQIQIDQARLWKQLHWPNADNYWLQQPPEDRRCVFLSAQGECQVYEQRPLACRKYFVVSEPELCNIDKNPKGRVAIWFDTNSEIIASAAMSFYGVDSMPRQLLRAAQGQFQPTNQPKEAAT
jgi:Fe-S-cluster containining protein